MEENLPPSARAEHMNKPIGEKVPRGEKIVAEEEA